MVAETFLWRWHIAEEGATKTMVQCLETLYNRKETHTKIKGASGDKEESREVMF